MVARLLPVLLACSLLAACATGGTRVVTDHDPAVDFDNFRTFEFASPLSTDERGRRTTTSVQLIVATTREMQARGLDLVSAGGDLRVDFFAAQGNSLPSGTFTMATPHSHSGLSTWRSYNLRMTAASGITEGVIVVDVVDARRNALVFEGMAEARVTEDMRDNFADTIGNAVAEIFAEFP